MVVDALARLRAASWDTGSIIGAKGVEDSHFAMVDAVAKDVTLQVLALGALARAQADEADQVQTLRARRPTKLTSARRPISRRDCCRFP